MIAEWIERLSQAKDPAEKAGLVAEAVLENRDPAVVWVAERVVILHWFNLRIVEALLRECDQPGASAEEVWAVLLDLPFMERSSLDDGSDPDGVALRYHSLTREGLLKRYIKENPGILIAGARIATPVYASMERSDFAAVTQAVFCSVVAGDLERALAVRDKGLALARARQDWISYSTIEWMQEEAERLPFVKPLSSALIHDLFVLCADADRGWVNEQILQHLQGSELSIRVIESGFRPESDLFEQDRRALLLSQRVFLIFSETFVTDLWPRLEMLLFEIGNFRMVPVLKDPVEVPPYLGSVISFEDQETAWTELAAVLGIDDPLVLAQEDQISPASWSLEHPYGMPPNFTGRGAERSYLSHWLDHDSDHPLLVVRALGGFGKSALCWHWLMNDVDPERWTRVVWWSFYEKDAGFGSFLAHILNYVGYPDPARLSVRQAADEVLRILSQERILIVMDGFERLLVAYRSMMAAYQGDEMLEVRSGEYEDNCVMPLVDQLLIALGRSSQIRGKILMTTRLLPRVLRVSDDRVLPGCELRDLEQLDPEDAVEFFRNSGIRGADFEIKRACELYGYHPLSLRLLVGYILGDPQQSGDIRVAQRVDPTGELKQRQHHVLEQAYEGLAPQDRALLSKIACFRSLITYEALQALVATQDQEGEKIQQLNQSLRSLIRRGLLQHDRRSNRYDLHPIVRRYAYDHFGSTDRKETHAQLRDYFAAVPTSSTYQTLDDLEPLIELFHHTIQAGLYEEAFSLYTSKLLQPLFQLGAFLLDAEILRSFFPDGEDEIPVLTSHSSQAMVISDLATAYHLTAELERSMQLCRQGIRLAETSEGSKLWLSYCYLNLAQNLECMGNLREAEKYYRRYVEILMSENNPHFFSYHLHLGRSFRHRGLWKEAEQEAMEGLADLEKRKASIYWTSDMILSDRSRLISLRAQIAIAQARYGIPSGAVSLAQQALSILNENPIPSRWDLMQCHHDLGRAYLLSHELTNAEIHLNHALELSHQINVAYQEARILLSFSELNLVREELSLASDLADKARMTADRIKDVLFQADVYVVLARIALAQNDRSTALDHARKARQLATCDGPPDYTHKVAYDAAGDLLRHLGEDPDL